MTSMRQLSPEPVPLPFPIHRNRACAYHQTNHHRLIRVRLYTYIGVPAHDTNQTTTPLPTLKKRKKHLQTQTNPAIGTTY